MKIQYQAPKDENYEEEGSQVTHNEETELACRKGTELI
jgi:hypothetical protein